MVKISVENDFLWVLIEQVQHLEHKKDAGIKKKKQKHLF